MSALLTCCSAISNRRCSNALCCSFVWSTMFFPPHRSLLSIAWKQNESVRFIGRTIIQSYYKRSSINIRLYVCPTVCLYVCQSVCLFACFSVCLYVCPSAWMSVCLSVCMFVPFSVCLMVCMFAGLHVCWSAYLLVGMSVSLYIFVFFVCFVFLSVCIFVCLYVCWSVCLSVVTWPRSSSWPDLDLLHESIFRFLLLLNAFLFVVQIRQQFLLLLQFKAH